MNRGANSTSMGVRGPLATWAAGLRKRWPVLVAMGIIPCAACTALVLALLAARWWYSGVPTFRFLVWNLFLAWLPWFFAVPLAVAPSGRRGWRVLPMFFAWLAFLPNAPYLVTDLLHLDERRPVPLWFDASLLFIAAWTGCLLGFLSLAPVHRRVEAWLGRKAGWAFVGAVAFLCGFGVYIGRFLRWNSWDLVTRPAALWRDFANRALDPSNHARTLGVTALFAAFMLFGYGTFARVRTDVSPGRRE